MNRTHHTNRAAFSLLELSLTLLVLALLVGLVGFEPRPTAVDGAAVTRLETLVHELEDACARHHRDTGRLAYEYAHYDAPHRKLSAPQRASGWSGPYLSAQLAHFASNPYGSVHVYNDVRVNGWIGGFDVDGDGAAEVAAEANMLWLSGIDAGTALALDAALDGTLGREDSAASAVGRVRFDPARRFVWVLLYAPH